MATFLNFFRQIRQISTVEAPASFKVTILSSFATGWAISALGSLSPGSLNVMILNESIHSGWMSGVFSSWGALTVEVLFVLIALRGVGQVHERKHIFRLLEWITCAFILMLSVLIFVSLGKSSTGGSVVREALPVMHPFLLGASLRVLTPVCVPYWVAWNTILLSKGWIEQGKGRFEAYALGIGLGTFTSHSVYIFGGVAAQGFLLRHQVVLQSAIGILLLATALWLLKKLIAKPLAQK